MALRVGTRVKRSDWAQSSIPAYRETVGTVVGVGVSRLGVPIARVAWDCDRSVSQSGLEGWYCFGALVEKGATNE